MPYKATVEFDSIVLRDHRLQVIRKMIATNLNLLGTSVKWYIERSAENTIPKYMFVVATQPGSGASKLHQNVRKYVKILYLSRMVHDSVSWYNQGPF